VAHGHKYDVLWQATPSPIPLNETFDLVVEVRRHDAAAKSASDVALNVDARMPAHGHGMNVLPRVSSKGDGKFAVSGLLFHMPGHWELYFDVTENAATERVQIDVNLE
jgi:hypothetical protein